MRLQTEEKQKDIKRGHAITAAAQKQNPGYKPDNSPSAVAKRAQAAGVRVDFQLLYNDPSYLEDLQDRFPSEMTKPGETARCPAPAHGKNWGSSGSQHIGALV